jgi:hypothetical protein
MYMFDVETLGTESTSVMLSAAITYFDFDELKRQPDATKLFYELVDRSCFVKLDARAQKKEYKRVWTPDTLDWWKKQSELSKEVSLTPKDTDLSAPKAIEILRDYMTKNGGNEKIIWARGSLDQMVIDSLCRSCWVEPLARYSLWRDVRTALDILPNGDSKRFSYDAHVVKHIPTHDCAADIIALLLATENA